MTMRKATYRATLLFGKKKHPDGTRKERFSGSIVSGDDFKFPHTAISSVRSVAKKELFTGTVGKQNQHMLDKKVKFKIRRVTTTGTKGRLIKSKTVTWNELLETPPSKLLGKGK